MYIIDEEYKKVLKSDEQQYDAYIILEDGTKVDTDISELKPIYNLGERIVGNFATKRVEFTLFNTSKYNITDHEIEVFIGLKVNNEFNYVSLGKFICNKPVIKDEAKDECTIIAQNYSLKFKVPYVNVLTFPCTIKEAIKSICEYINIVYAENDFINADYILEEFFIDEDATFFDVIKILAEASFANADITNSNSLIIKTPKKVRDYAFSLNELFEFKKEDNKFGPLNAIVASRIVADDGSTTEDVYAKDETSITENGIYEYKIKQNEAIDYDRQTAVNNILNGILNFEYIPATIEAVYNPAIEIGDMLEVPDKKTDTSFLLLAKQITADLQTGLMIIESTEKTKTETDYKSATNKDKRLKTEAKVNKLKGEIILAVSRSEEALTKTTEIKQTNEAITNTVSDIKQQVDDATGDITTIEKAVNVLEENVNGLKNTLETQGGSNLLLNSSGLFENEHWEGKTSTLTNTDIQNNFIAKACFNLQNGSMKQIINVVNGSYYIGFKYQKLLELANCKIIINGVETLLTSTSLKEVENIIEVSEHSITIEIISDTNNACLVGDIIIVQGSKQSWSSNMNEIYTSTVKIGIGLEIISNTMKTKLLANADGVRIVSTVNNKVVAEFTDKGMTTDELKANTAQIAGILIQKNNSQTWISSLL